MRQRRFLLLSGVILALNVALWLTPEGLALRKSVTAGLFGSHLVRAEVIESNGADWRLDRGIITQVSSTQLTLREVDGHVQAIGLSPSTHVVGAGRFALAQGWRVLVTWPANGSATTVKVERKTRTRSHGHGRPGGSPGSSGFHLSR